VKTWFPRKGVWLRGKNRKIARGWISLSKKADRKKLGTIVVGGKKGEISSERGGILRLSLGKNKTTSTKRKERRRVLAGRREDFWTFLK